MNPMLSALKNRRVSDKGASSDAAPQGEGKLEALVASLSAEDKAKLVELLAGESDESHTSAEAVDKGAPSSEEKTKINEQMAKDEAREGAEELGELESGVDSDEIALGMLDSRFKNGGPSKARNLHERAQMGMASNLKAKGKI